MLITILVACTRGEAERGVDPRAAERVVPPGITEETAPSMPGGYDLAAELFTDGSIPAFDLELSEQAMDGLRRVPDEWVEGAVVYRGVRLEPVGIRLKGNNSFLPIDEKPSLKLKFDRVLPGLTLLGLREVALDNMSTDPSMMAERVSYRLFREHGLPASRANHATVRINGEDRGLYTLVENVDDEFLALRYPDPGGAMWELADVEFERRDVDDFENESGPDDRAALEGIAEALDGPDPVAEAGRFVDWPQFVDFVAACAVVGQFDSYPWRSPGDDVHLYFDPLDGLMDTVPHGMDETFARPTRDVFDADGLLIRACLADPACSDDYEASLLEVQDTSERIDLLGYAATVRGEIAALAEADPRRPYTRSEIEDAQDELLDFVADRRDELSNQIRRH